MFPKVRKWPSYVVGAIVLIFVFKNPQAAAGVVNHAGSLLSQGANAVGRFASALHLG